MESACVQVDLEILANNISSVRSATRPETELIFVVKSDAYGHGTREVVRRAVAEGVRWFAVAFLREALEVREVAPEAKILILGAVAPSEAALLLEYQLTPVIVSAEQAEGLDAEAARLGGTIDGHLKIDSGMGRLGVMPEELPQTLQRIKAFGNLSISGIMSHLATVDLRRPWLQEKQCRIFRDAVALTEERLGKRLMRHFCSSRGFQYYPDWDFDAVRIGIVLYGYGSQEAGMRVRTHPLLEWRASLMQVKAVPDATPVGYYGSYRTTRDTRVAVVGAGYADGYLRAMSNRGEVIIRGKRYPVVGRISMNWITVDVGPDDQLEAGDAVTLIGSDGEGAIWADVLARRAKTIAYEILTAIDPRIPRQYSGA